MLKRRSKIDTGTVGFSKTYHSLEQAENRFMSTVDGIEGGEIGTETQPEIMLGTDDGLPLHHESLLPGQDSSSQQTHRQSVGNYVKSENFIELTICLGVFAVGFFVSEFIFKPRTRSALLQNTQEGDTIYDFRFGEAYVDETIPSKFADAYFYISALCNHLLFL
jgi:hypothetical protein